LGYFYIESKSSNSAGLHVIWNQKLGLKNVGLLGLKLNARVGMFQFHSPSCGRMSWPIVKSQDFLAWSINVATHKAFWRVNQGMDDTKVGTNRNLEKAVVHSIVGAETMVLEPEGAIRNGGVQTVSLLVRSSPEALVFGKNGLDSEYSAVAPG